MAGALGVTCVRWVPKPHRWKFPREACVLPSRRSSGLLESGLGGGSPASSIPEPAKGLKTSVDGRGLCYGQGKAVPAEEQPVLNFSAVSHLCMQGTASVPGLGVGQKSPKLQDAAEEHRGVCRAVSARRCPGLGCVEDGGSGGGWCLAVIPRRSKHDMDKSGNLSG